MQFGGITPLPTDQAPIENCVKNKAVTVSHLNHCINFFFLLKPSYAKNQHLTQFSLDTLQI